MFACWRFECEQYSRFMEFKEEIMIWACFHESVPNIFFCALYILESCSLKSICRQGSLSLRVTLSPWMPFLHGRYDFQQAHSNFISLLNIFCFHFRTIELKCVFRLWNMQRQSYVCVSLCLCVTLTLAMACECESYPFRSTCRLNYKFYNLGRDQCVMCMCEREKREKCE